MRTFRCGAATVAACLLGSLLPARTGWAALPPIPLAAGGAWSATRDRSSAPPEGCAVSGWDGWYDSRGHDHGTIGLDRMNGRTEITIGFGYPIFGSDRPKRFVLDIDGSPSSMSVTSGNERDMVAVLAEDRVLPLVRALERGRALRVTARNMDPLTLPLGGAAPAFEAFRRCLGPDLS